MQKQLTPQKKKILNFINSYSVKHGYSPSLEEIKKKMLLGKMATYFKEKTLMDQAFIKDGNKTIGKLLEENKAKIKEVKRYSI